MSQSSLAIAAALAHGQQKLHLRIAEDPWLWASTYTKTYDEHWKEKGKPSPYSSFPDKDYLAHFIRYLLTPTRLFVPKSRDMMVSWATIAYGVWSCQTRARTRVVVQAQKEDKVYDLVGSDPSGYARTLYEQQPAWLRALYPLKGDIKLARMAWENGSVFQGVPAGSDQVRQYHPTILIVDEACFVEDFQSSYEAASPVCGQIIAISSAWPGFFMDCASEAV